MDFFLLEGLTEKEKTQAEKYFAPIQSFSKNDELYKIGSIGILLSGNASVKRNALGGDSTVIRSAKPGEIFGSASVFGDWKSGMSSITANCSCTVSYIKETDFKELLMTFPKISFNYISFLTEKLRFLNRKLDSFSAETTQSKLYEFLLGISSDGEVELEYGMSELARRLKIGRTSLYRDIEALERSGLLVRNGNKFILK